MAIKMEQLPATSTNPALNVAKDGTVLYSNEAGNLLLNEWGVAAGDKLPSDIGDLVIRVLSLNSPEKMEIKVGNRVYLIVLHPIPEELYVNISGFDITDLKQAEEKTKLEEDRFAKIERLAEVGYWEWDVIKDDFIWSEQMYKIYRRNPNLKPPRYSEHHLYFTPESWARLERESKRTLEYEEPSELELEHIREDGSHGWQIARAEAVFDKVGHVIKLWGSVRDITEQKQAEEEVKNASNMLQLIMNNIPQAIFWKDCNSRYLGCNKVFAEDAGFQSPENIVGKTDYDLPWALEQTEWYHKCDRRVMKNDTPEYHIYETQTTAEGKLTWLDTNKIPLHDSKGNVIGILGTYEDITERKKAEEALRLLNLYNRSLIETCLDPLVTIGHDGKIMDVNRATEAVTGYTRNELIGNDFSDYFTEPEKARAGYQQVFTDGKVRDYPLEIQHKDGHVTPVLYNASVYNDESGKVIGVFAAARDISERKKAEDALQESKAKLEAALESMTDAVFMSDTQGNLINFNEAFATFHKFKSKEDCYKTLSEYPDYIDVYFADGTLAPLDMWAIPRALRGETVTDAEYILRRKDTGETWTASYNFAPIRDKDGEIVGSVVIGRDITERKQAEKALMESESFLKFAQVSAGAGVWDWDMSNDKLKWSDELFQLFGLDPKITDASFEIWRSVIHPDDKLNAEKRIYEAINDHIPLQNEYRIVLPSSEVRWISALGDTEYDSNGKPIRMSGICIDISERKKAEEALKEAHDTLEEKVKERTAELKEAYTSLKESERSLADAQEMAHLGNWNWNIETGELFWSDEVYRIFGLSPHEFRITYDIFLNYVHPNDREYLINAIKEGLFGRSVSVECRIILDNGEERILYLEAKVFIHAENAPFQVKGIAQDITERKRVEEKLRESEDKYRNIVETANEGIAQFNSKGIITYVNKKMADILGYNIEEIIGKTLWEFLGEYDGNSLTTYFDQKQFSSSSYEIKLKCKDGSFLWLFVNSKSLFDKDGNLVSAINLYTDITKRKLAEQALDNIDIVRKQEIHHRIKNNLQVISSLLDLQAEKFNDKKVVDAFKDSQDRVISMALIHEELYKGGALDTLNFSHYIEELADSLLLTYRVGKNGIILKNDIDDNIFFDMDTSVPLGIIINELVSNSLKHAFPDRDNGEIQIKLHRDEGCNFTYVLSVSDNGIGIPEDLDIENLDSLGLQLVTTLVDQLDGELELKRDNGTEFIIKFTV